MTLSVTKMLLIAEKPSVANDLSRALSKDPSLGKFEKKGKDRDTYFENAHCIITSAVGHLVTLKMPEATGKDGKQRKLPWNFDVLPAIPTTFELEAIETSRSRLKQVLKLARRKDVGLLINACDAGREGELIFRYILEYGKIHKPVKRLWMQSMTQQSILEAWKHLRSEEEMQHLCDAAKCRSEADWIVGLNSTRALTCFRSRHGGFNMTPAGRVQTPTLAILAKREREITAFRPEDYWEVHGTFQAAQGDYTGRWFNTAWQKDPNQPHGKAERIWEKSYAKEIVARCQDQQAQVEETTKPSSQIAPQLYDLTSLQRDAAMRFGFSARRTLQVAQALYEKYKMLTYPRTDSRYLPEDYLAKVKETLGGFDKSMGGVGICADKVLKKKWVQPSKRIFNNTKISDHFAIIPTGRFVKLDEAASKLFDLVAKRFIAVFYPPAQYEVTKRITTIESAVGTDSFLTSGKVLIDAGWLEVYGRRVGEKTSKGELIPLKKGENIVQNTSIELLEEETRPPARYNEATLLSAMEGAGKLIEDENLREAMAQRGLGTPATRAAIIEGLLRQKYLERDGRELLVTRRGLRLIEITEELGIEALASPEMTGEWESKLHDMEQGLLSRQHFMADIVGFTSDIVDRAKKYTQELQDRVFEDLPVACPACGKSPMKVSDGTYACYDESCGFKINSHVATRAISRQEAMMLFKEGRIGPFDNFKSRFNKPFEASLVLKKPSSKAKNAKWKLDFLFNDDLQDNEPLDKSKIIGKVQLGDKEEKDVYGLEKSWMIPDWTTKSAPDGFRIARTILQKTLSDQEVLTLLKEGKTPLINGFISKRTKRPFSAHLTLDKTSGKVGFEFAERKSAKASS